MTQDSLEAVQEEYDLRWKIEEFHREVKQVTGIEKCQCRIGRIQRNHIACAIMVWNCLKKVANASSATVYQIKSGLFFSIHTRLFIARITRCPISLLPRVNRQEHFMESLQ
jgi:hypothetical protein